MPPLGRWTRGRDLFLLFCWFVQGGGALEPLLLGLALDSSFWLRELSPLFFHDEQDRGGAHSSSFLSRSSEGTDIALSLLRSLRGGDDSAVSPRILLPPLAGWAGLSPSPPSRGSLQFGLDPPTFDCVPFSLLPPLASACC